MLVIAERNFPGYDLWAAAAATEADLLWRASPTPACAGRGAACPAPNLSYLAQPGIRGRGADPGTRHRVHLHASASEYRTRTAADSR